MLSGEKPLARGRTTEAALIWKKWPWFSVQTTRPWTSRTKMLVIWQIHLVSLVRIILFGNPVGGRPYFCLCTYSARASIIHKRCHPFQGTTHYLLAILRQDDVENHCTNYPVQHFFCNSSSFPVYTASRKMDGTAWQYLSIKKDSPCVTIFLVYEMSSVQQSFSGDAENDKARFLAICCSFSKPCCLPLPDFANLRELFLALARLCCLSRLLLAISPPFQVVWQWEGHLGGTWVLQRVFRMFSNSFLEIVDFSSFHIWAHTRS